MTAILFWLALFLLIYAYAGYPLFVRWMGGRLLPRPAETAGNLGRTWLLIPAYNEEAVIVARLENALAVTPADAGIVVVSDGSTDSTDAIVKDFERRDPRVRLFRVEGRRGKNHALNHALGLVAPQPDDVIVFTDANAHFAAGAIAALRERLAAGAACVVGKLEFVDAVTGTAQAEGLYWRYENALKHAEGAIGRLPFANGAIFAVRFREVSELPPDVGNDFWIPILVLGSGRSVVFEPAAVAREPAPARGREEFLRKVRMANRQIRGVILSWPHLDGATRFQLVSHKVLRWLGLPIMALVACTAVALWETHIAYRAAAVAISASAVLAAAGVLVSGVGLRVPLLNLPVHFYRVHIAALIGILEAVLGRRRATWDQAQSARRLAGIEES